MAYNNDKDSIAIGIRNSVVKFGRRMMDHDDDSIAIRTTSGRTGIVDEPFRDQAVWSRSDASSSNPSTTIEFSIVLHTFYIVTQQSSSSNPPTLFAFLVQFRRGSLGSGCVCYQSNISSIFLTTRASQVLYHSTAIFYDLMIKKIGFSL